MRKSRHLPPEALQAYEWSPPGEVGFQLWGTGDPKAPRGPVEPIHWPTLFGNEHPVELEVGFGKGLFLMNQAQVQPRRNFFGIEIIRKFHYFATNRIAKLGLKNVRTCCADAKRILEDFVPPASLSVIHVYFPDPWWKERHKKRLLMTEAFCGLIERALVDGGQLHFATDVPEYASWVQETLAQQPGLQLIGQLLATEPQHDMDYLTHFERRFRKLGKPIHRAIYARANRRV